MLRNPHPNPLPRGEREAGSRAFPSKAVVPPHSKGFLEGGGVLAFEGAAGVTGAGGGREGGERGGACATVFAGITGFLAAFVELVLAFEGAVGMTGTGGGGEGGDGGTFGSTVFAGVLGHGVFGLVELLLLVGDGLVDWVGVGMEGEKENAEKEEMAEHGER